MKSPQSMRYFQSFRIFLNPLKHEFLFGVKLRKGIQSWDFKESLLLGRVGVNQGWRSVPFTLGASRIVAPVSPVGRCEIFTATHVLDEEVSNSNCTQSRRIILKITVDRKSFSAKVFLLKVNTKLTIMPTSECKVKIIIEFRTLLHFCPSLLM